MKTIPETLALEKASKYMLSKEDSSRYVIHDKLHIKNPFIKLQDRALNINEDKQMVFEQLTQLITEFQTKANPEM